jgi:putative transposase
VDRQPAAIIEKAQPDIADAGMARLMQMLSHKAERSGGRLIKEDARQASQDCSACGTRVAKPLGQRTRRCGTCGLTLDRGWNAARTSWRAG